MSSLALAEASFTDVREALARVTTDAAPCSSFQEAAQTAARRVYSDFSKSLVLARIYAAVRFRELPERDRRFVTDLRGRNAPDAELNADTPVVSLMGTHGASPLWLDRYASQGHLGIPLLSEAFLRDIPMMWKLLSDLGVSVRGFATASTDSTTFNNFTGVFYVGDAASTRDPEGRFIIPARDFVKRYAVRTVFGVGGSFSNGMVVMALLFTREQVPRPVANRFLPLVRHLAEASSAHVSSGRLFPPVRHS
jgi:hypothetical protein